ncbi:MAG: methyltransferase domain-containing protein [Bryobacterales bacterium]|nr:methyltransferase domain-containing protein [Bryobacterales bacterium]
MTDNTTIDTARLEQFMGQVVNDMAASMSVMMTDLGGKLGLYKAMAGAGPMTASDLAARTGTHERYVREWLNNQAAGAYVTYHPATDTYELPAEHAMVLAREDSPVFMANGFGTAASMWFGQERIFEAFRTGRGIGWHEQHRSLHLATEYFFRTGYRAHLTTQWIPALDGVEEKLRSGARVADVGCGHGASTIIMAQAYPDSRFFGFDYHDASIATATERAAEAGVAGRAQFAAASAKQYPRANYDLICFMDCLHDLGDPLGAAKHARQAIAPDGVVMLVEPNAGDTVADNLHPVGRLFYAASTAFCTPNSLSQEVGAALGAQAGEARLREIFREAGFRHFRQAARTPFNLILEARP